MSRVFLAEETRLSRQVALKVLPPEMSAGVNAERFTAGFRCVVFGPGSIEVAHRPNEFLPVAEFERAGELLDDIIRRRCVAE